MKIRDGFLLREIADTHVVVPVGERVIDFKGMMILNEIGSFIWIKLQDECTFDEILDSIVENYEVDVETARVDLDKFLNSMRENEALDE